MNKMLYLNQQELDWVNSQDKGYVRGLIQSAMLEPYNLPQIAQDLKDPRQTFTENLISAATGIPKEAITVTTKDPIQDAQKRLEELTGVVGVAAAPPTPEYDSPLFKGEQEVVTIDRKPPIAPNCPAFKDLVGLTWPCSGCKGRPECEETYG